MRFSMDSSSFMIAADTSDSDVVAGLSEPVLFAAAALPVAVFVAAFVGPAADGWAGLFRFARSARAGTWGWACAEQLGA
jgi:hypothetical protein